MKQFFLLLFIFLSLISSAQNYKDKVSFKSDLWLILQFEEGVYPIGDTLNITWQDKKIKKGNNPVYVDISKDLTMLHFKFPLKKTFTSEGLLNNGFISEKKFSEYSMYIRSFVKDENGYLYIVTVGKDGVWEDEKNKQNGRIYVVLEDPKKVNPSWYFTVKPFGQNK
jgi:hypothetical protein